MEPKVLLLEDEESIRGFVKINLKRIGYQVIEASTGEEAIQLVQEHQDVQIALLDVMLPTSLTGFDICKWLRQNHVHIGIIMLTAKGQDMDKVKGLELGADDYVTKPFSPTELVARINSLSRRLSLASREQLITTEEIHSGPFMLSLDEHKLLKNSQDILLTPTEFHIMKLFMESPNKTISRDDILDQVWGRHFVGDFKIVDVNIRRIRQKIEDDPSNPQYIGTVWGCGYIWKKDPH